MPNPVYYVLYVLYYILYYIVFCIVQPCVLAAGEVGCGGPWGPPGWRYLWAVKL